MPCRRPCPPMCGVHLLKCARRARARAGFHSAALYGALRGAVGPLVALLRDGEDKTRANAAGALGNLVRNSPMLCRQLVQAGALEARAPCPETFPPQGSQRGRPRGQCLPCCNKCVAWHERKDCSASTSAPLCPNSTEHVASLAGRARLQAGNAPPSTGAHARAPARARRRWWPQCARRRTAGARARRRWSRRASRCSRSATWPRTASAARRWPRSACTTCSRACSRRRRMRRAPAATLAPGVIGYRWRRQPLHACRGALAAPCRAGGLRAVRVQLTPL